MDGHAPRCSLDGAHLTDRLAAWGRLSVRALSRTVDRDRIVAVYPSELALVEEIRQLVAAEAECCSFLSFTIIEEPSTTRVELAFPPEARSLVGHGFEAWAAKDE